MPRPPLALVAGTYITYGRTPPEYAQVTQVVDGRPRFRHVHPENIPAGTLVQPVKWEGPRMVPAARPPRPFDPPPPWRSGVPCANRAGQPAVVEPQCDGAAQAEVLVRAANVHAAPGAPPITDAHVAALRGAEPMAAARGMMERLNAAFAPTEHALCNACASALMHRGRPVPGQLAAPAPPQRFTAFLSMRPRGR